MIPRPDVTVGLLFALGLTCLALAAPWPARDAPGAACEACGAGCVCGNVCPCPDAEATGRPDP